MSTRPYLRHGGSALKILDVGCGDGQLLTYLAAVLPSVMPVPFELHGYEVKDSTSRRDDYPDDVIARLVNNHPGVDWEHRIHVGGVTTPWPLSDGSIDIVVTNQVIEHVVCLDFFLAELRRVLKPGGTSVHLFPLRGCLWEGHLHTPLAAQCKGHEQRVTLLRAFGALGVGKARRQADEVAADYAKQIYEEKADYIQFATQYRTLSNIVQRCKAVGLRVSYRHTAGLYRHRVRRIVGLPPRVRAYRERHAAVEWLLFSLLRRMASVTIHLERPSPGARFVDVGDAPAG